MIHFNKETMTFHLKNRDVSYVLSVENNRNISHLYWGASINDDELNYLNRPTLPAFCPETEGIIRNSRDSMRHDYPINSQGDFRMPAIALEDMDGNTRFEFEYNQHRIFEGKSLIEGLPSTYIESDEEASSLEIDMIEKNYGIMLTLTYTIYEDRAVITRNIRVSNTGDKTCRINRILSIGIDFDNADYDMVQLSGAWAREREICRHTLVRGNQDIQSIRGSSSHQQNPFIALVGKNADEVNGEAYGFNLVYSSNFIAGVEVDQFAQSRVYMGINPHEFSWLLEEGEVFQTPEVVMVYSNEGIGKMSRIFHSLYRERLIRGKFRDEERPVLINNWEATYFEFNAEKIEAIAKVGSELGMELMVLDDGWFGQRDDDTSSLGDWRIDYKKLPDGLEDLTKRVNGMAMQFGLWFEPEMVSPDSELYRAHPEWCIRQKIYQPIQSRNQLVLDYTRKEVCDYIVESVGGILRSCNIQYVKWDCNRSLTDVGSSGLPKERQREVAHRHILGVYNVMERLTTEFGHVLFESCSGGGARFDAGMLHYMPQVWTSDDTDAVQRLKIQYGTSLVYPICAMGAHVSAVPNHQTGRVTSFKTRGDVAVTGAFGYELDLTSLTEEEKSLVKEQIRAYKSYRKWVAQGDFYRILSPFEGNETAWINVSSDKSKALVMHMRVLSEPNTYGRRLKLQGLDETKQYKITGIEKALYGDTLMNAGIYVGYKQVDFYSQVWYIEEVSLK